MLYIAIRTLTRPSMASDEELYVPMAERLAGLRHLGPVVFLIVLVLGSMYGGYASPSEAAAVGVVGALIVSAMQRTLTFANLRQACFGAVRTISMIGLIVAGAYFLSIAIGYLGVPRIIAGEIAGLGLSPFGLIMLLLVFYAILGCVLEGMSSIVMTLPITLALVTQAGFDKVWFGIFLVIVVEMAQITPPVGFNLFVIQGMTGEKIGRIAIATLALLLHHGGHGALDYGLPRNRHVPAREHQAEGLNRRSPAAPLPFQSAAAGRGAVRSISAFSAAIDSSCRREASSSRRLASSSRRRASSSALAASRAKAVITSSWRRSSAS